MALNTFDILKEIRALEDLLNEVNPETGEVLVEKGNKITAEIAEEIQDSGINIVDVNPLFLML